MARRSAQDTQSSRDTHKPFGVNGSSRGPSVGGNALSGNEGGRVPAGEDPRCYTWSRRGSLMRGFLRGTVLGVLASLMVNGLSLLLPSPRLAAIGLMLCPLIVALDLGVSYSLAVHAAVLKPCAGMPQIGVEVTLCGKTLVCRRHQDLTAVWCREEWSTPVGVDGGNVSFRLSAIQRGVTVDLLGWGFDWFFGLTGPELVDIADAWRAAAQEAAGEAEGTHKSDA